MIIVTILELPSSSKKHQTLAELFKPPTDIMFHGTFQEVRTCTYVYTCTLWHFL